MQRRLVVLVVALLVGLLAPVPASAQQQSGATLRIGTQQQIDSLNPFLGYSLAATDIFRAVYPTLTTYNAKDFAVEPELAQSWESSPDKLTWTFHLRPGVKWSDGQPVTARDAAYTFDRMMHDKAAATANGNFVENFDTVAAPDDNTLVIRTKSAQATMLAIDAPIVPEHVWAKVGDVAKFANDQMPVVGSGPFTITEYRPEQDITLTANPNYWRGAPKVARMQFVQFKNSDAAVQALRKGDVDVVQKLTPAQFDALAGQSDVQQVKGQGRRFYELLLNPGATNSQNQPIGTGHPALRDVRVRQAIDHAIDRKVLVDKVLGGHGQLGGGYLPPIFGDYHWNPPQPRAFDPALANRMLDEAGYARGPDGIRRTPQGEPLNFDFMLHGDESMDSQVGQYVKRWLADVGINTDLQPVSDNQVNDRTVAGDFDLAVSGWSANPDPDYVLRLQTCGSRPTPEGGGNPDSFLCDPVYDGLYARQLAEFDPAKRVDLVKQAEARFYDRAAGLTLFYQNSLEAYRTDRFSGFQLQPATGGVITGQQGFWGYYGAQPTAKAINGGGTDRTAVAWGAAVVVVLLIIAGAVLRRRRRASADERE